MAREQIVHFALNWGKIGGTVTVKDGVRGYDCLCGTYLYDSSTDPVSVTPHKSSVTCLKCRKALERMGE